MSIKLPQTEAERNTWIKFHKLADLTVHDDIKLASASTIKEQQYLALRVLWKTHKSKDLDVEKFDLKIWISKADELLRSFQSWQGYRQSFKTSIIPEGTFALARKYQKQAALSTDETLRPSVSISPISQRTRSQISSLTKRLRDAQLQTPTKSRGDPLDYFKIEGEEKEEDENDEDENEETPFVSPGPSEIVNLMYPPTKDEQIVNTALVNFLNALTMHFPAANDWTLHRKSFKADFQKASFEARTDGYLEDHSDPDKARALIEVKPIMRNKKRDRICMQEAAQMAAWIKTDPDLHGCLNKPGRRLHISQDRHQLFIIIAEYSQDYIDYLNKKPPVGSALPFLTMHEYGAWDTSILREMDSIARIILAIALRAHSDCRGASKLTDK
ncbi:hypothetical protein P175DRAFT_0487414 [Aspergillus ochraceoroseus IBT 24754]|uniref:Uncharacterized protein n=2 Tax=Aspergillus ochraceoroseus TaxID=138278 RepID=A0A2T5LLN1_9EURO|nr:uncharacterized protein P175DRAFT_0487414 [Aspergillus ochraceoroseus IBT 24754]KKK17411.1 hypothetical protein AOCH_006726 [Aspergillus ochraceoroseus]PTU17188.1 hypothetical protein P175DRAFT_0487414 [Aspergillus ochraceoroseus IBT 24754]